MARSFDSASCFELSKVIRQAFLLQLAPSKSVVQGSRTTLSDGTFDQKNMLSGKQKMQKSWR